MQRRNDGSVVLAENEAKGVALVLEYAQNLVDQLEASKQPASSNTVEYNLLIVLELIEELGVSSDELTGKLDRQPKAG